MLREFLRDERLQIVVMLDAVGEGVADDGDALAGVEGDGRVDRGGGGRSRRGSDGGERGFGGGGGFFLFGVGWRRRGGRRVGADGDGLAEGVDGGGELVAEAVEAVFARGVRIDERDVGLGGDGEIDGPEDGVDDETAERLVFEVGGGAHRGGEDFVFLAALVFEGAGPGYGHRGSVEWLLLFISGALLDGLGGGVAGIHALEHEAAEEDLGVGGRISFVDIAVPENVGDAAEEGVGGGGRLGDATGGLGLVFTPVGNPRFAEDVFAETAGPRGFAVPAVFRPLTIGGNIEGMGRCAEGDERDAAFEGGDEALHVGIEPVAETQAENDRVGGVEGGGVGEGFLVIGVDRTVGVEGEEHGAFEAVTLAQDFREHGHRFLAAVFFIAREEDDVFALGFDAGGGREDEAGRGGGAEERGGEEGEEGEGTEEHGKREDPQRPTLNPAR